MHRIFLSITLIIVSLYLLNCSAPTIIQTTKEDNINKVNIETLIANIKKYLGLTVQTRGIYNLSFENSSIFPASPEYYNGNFIFKIKSWPGLWVELDLKHMPPDSIERFSYRKNGLLATIQGIVDTSQTGHLGQYIATMTNARFIVEK